MQGFDNNVITQTIIHESVKTFIVKLELWHGPKLAVS